ncbi:glycoside hydrolase family 13 protein [Lachnospiraceae bacterium CLA-AA-H185]|jgi:alpha-glucosidase|uniref:Glycoside hydrolase family 13 protein n=1 Tax=Maccoyibacter intestinihominis TaxID=3133499 RepID=A0ABV1HG15_9FIRM
MNQKSIYDLSRIERYMMQMRPVLSKKALFSDGTKDYRSPAEPRENDKVTIRFRTKRDNVDMVWLCSREKKQRMKRTETKWDFDYYSVEIQLGSEPFFYYFKVVTGILECYYDRYGVNDKPREEYYFCIVPGFSTPEWAKGAVMYQILVDRFYNGNPAGDVLDGEYYYVDGPTKHVENWAHCPQGISVREFYGGDLEGVRQKLDYLQELGIEVLYFNPLFVSPSNHKYDCQDYDYIDPHVSNIVVDEGAVLPEGCKDNTQAARYITRVTDKRNLEASNAYFAKFVEEVHAHGMKIILDGVFNHCGSFHKWLDREKLYEQQGGYAPGAYVSRESPYRDFFAFQNQEAWPDNGSYEGWWGFETLPKLNYEGSQELWNYVLDIGRKWVSHPYNVDGWRLDVAADLGHSPEVNHRFWKEFRKAVKEANPNAVILAEHYGDPKSWLLGDEWDTIMNYDAFMEPITWFLTGMEKHSDEYRGECFGNPGDFEGAMRHHMTRFMTSSLQCAMNELSNHDHSRFLTRTNKKVGRAEQLGTDAAGRGINKGVMKEAVVFQMTWPGAPTLYYGDEVGQVGFTDPDNRRTYPWGNEDMDLLNFHREMIRIHKEHEAFKTGSIQFVWGEYNFLCYARYNRREHFLVVLNNDAVSRTVEMVVWPVGLPKECELEQIMYSHEGGYSTNPVTYEVKGGKLNITLTEFSAVVLRLKETSGGALPD